MNILDFHRGISSKSALKKDLLLRLKKIEANSEKNHWITVLSEEQLMAYIEKLPEHPDANTPLWGIPFAIKDNIDLQGIPTTAACPGFSYVPDESATTVQLLLNAGAIPLGKTNMDQFATGLVGTRSPYGACKNAFDSSYISGGSSSGSAVSVALEEVLFSLGTDTAGSGRVPAAYHGIYGLKASVGRISCTGVVPACKTLDCLTLFSKHIDDFKTVLPVVNQFDPRDTFSRKLDLVKSKTLWKIGVPRPEDLEFFGDAAYAKKYEAFLSTLEGKFAITEIDYSVFKETAELLYGGPWVAERLCALEDYFKSEPNDLDPSVANIVSSASSLKATDTFKAIYQLKENQRKAAEIWKSIDILLTPTVPSHYTQAEIASNPIGLNTNLGYYNNHMNLLDLVGLAFPTHSSGATPHPDQFFGITAQAPKEQELMLMNFVQHWEKGKK